MEVKILISHYPGEDNAVPHRVYTPAYFEQAEKDLALLQSETHGPKWKLVTCEVYDPAGSDQGPSETEFNDALAAVGLQFSSQLNPFYMFKLGWLAARRIPVKIERA